MAKTPAKAKKGSTLPDGFDLDQYVAQMKDDYGEASVYDAITAVNVDRSPSGIFALDYAIGGGFPRGRVSEVYGKEGSGKTNLVLKTMATAQKLEPDKRPAFIDIEHALTPEWARSMGVNPDKVIYLRPNFAEQAVDMVEKVTQAKGLSMVAMDSIAAMAATAEMDKSAENDLPGLNARIGGKLMRKMVFALGQVEDAILRGERSGSMPAVIFINQIRMKIGVMYGSPETTPGGNALPFLYALRLSLYGTNVMDNKINAAMPIAKSTSATLKKWKVPVLAQKAEYDIVMQPFKGHKVGEVLDWTTLNPMMKEAGLLKNPKAGVWTMCGTDYQKLKDCEDVYYGDVNFRTMLHKAFIEQALLDAEDVSLDSNDVLGAEENAA